MPNPQYPELPTNALIGIGGRPIELRDPLSFKNDTDHLAVATLLATPLSRGSGQLLGYTSGGSPATPPTLPLSFSPLGARASFALYIDGTVTMNVVMDTDLALNPADYPSDVIVEGNDIPALVATLNGRGGLVVTQIDPTHCTIAGPSTGSSHTLTLNTPGGAFGGDSHAPFDSYIGTFTGTDSVAPSGEVAEVELIPLASGKTLKMVSAGFGGSTSLAAQWELALKDGSGNYFRLALVAANDPTPRTLPADLASVADWINGRADVSLVAHMIDATPVGGDVTAWAIAEQL